MRSRLIFSVLTYNVFKQKRQTRCEAGTESHGSRGGDGRVASLFNFHDFRNAKPVVKRGRKATGLDRDSRATSFHQDI